MLRFVGFLTDGVGPDWAQQIVASDLGMCYLLHYNHAIIFILLKIVGFLADGVEPDLARRVVAFNLAGYAQVPGSQHGDKIGRLFCWELISWPMV